MRTKAKHRVDMFKMMALPNDRLEFNEYISISPKLCAYIGCVLVLPLVRRKQIYVWG